MGLVKSLPSLLKVNSVSFKWDILGFKGKLRLVWWYWASVNLQYYTFNKNYVKPTELKQIVIQLSRPRKIYKESIRLR